MQKLQVEQEVLRGATDHLANTKDELKEAKDEAERLREDLRKQSQTKKD